MDKKLEVNNLQISFRTQGGIVKAVRNISFDLYKGETLAIVGESGSGKSVTSKAIMGILAGNSIVEGGEILYNGQDLLKIDEEDFHKIRGDKIAMIFQDPMSSLNPIMRIGQQLTEAMILKAKTGKKNAKHEFNTMLKILGENINAADAEKGVDNKADVSAKLKKFNNFCLESTKVEGVYNQTYGEATQVEVQVENLLLYIQKDKKIDVPAELNAIAKNFSESFNPYVVVKNEESVGLYEAMKSLARQGKKLDTKAAVPTLQRVLELTKEALAKDKPNFFTMGYYLSENPTADLSKMAVAEMNAMTRKYLDDNFLLDFIRMAEKGALYAHEKAVANKAECLVELKQALDYFKSGAIDAKKSAEYVKSLSAKSQKAINRLSVKKDSTEYVFHSAFRAAVNGYFAGVKNNPVEEKIYLKNKAKYDKMLAKGQEPDWVLKPQVVVDLDLQITNICKIIEKLIASYENSIQNTTRYNPNAEVVAIIDFLKEQASRVVVKMNKQIAKAKAIKLMEEVGIPEPAARFNQFPFEFSGGMRQRIVIAIALSANPDILICDEPTTALDVTIQGQILELINDIKRQRNLSVIFITHNLGVVANMADRIAVMYAGKIVENGTSEEVFYEPAHPYTWALLSSMPDLDTKEKLESIPGTPPNMIYPPKGDAFAARNKYALEIDFELEPPMFDITETHRAATWLLHPNAPKVEMPQVIKARIERMKSKEAQ